MYYPDVTGVISQSNTKYFKIRSDGSEVMIPCDTLSQATNVRSMLASFGLPSYHKQTTDRLLKELDGVCTFSPTEIVERVGWNGSRNFALHDGQQYLGTKGKELKSTISIDGSKCEQRGKGQEWYRGVAQRLIGQRVPTFCLSFAFAPPLLDIISRNQNIGFELVGAPGLGKTTVQELAASVLGCPTRNAGTPYMTSMHTTVNGLEQTMVEHSDLPLIMDDASLFAMEQSKARKAEAFQAITFKLSSGLAKTRFNGDADRAAVKLGFLISTNETLSTMLMIDTDATRAARDRLLTIPIGPTSTYGVFDFVPEGYSTSSKFAAGLTAAAEANHGHAIRKYLPRLIHARAEDPGKLKKRILRFMRRFRRKVAVDENNGSAIRIVDAFGLVYAAGRLAQEFACLPGDMDVMEAVQHCYLLNRMDDTPPPPFSERLSELQQDARTVKWSSKKPRAVANADILLYKRDGREEIWIRPRVIEKVFPDWKFIRSGSDVSELLIAERGRKQNKRLAGPKLKAVRMFVFRVNVDE